VLNCKKYPPTIRNPQLSLQSLKLINFTLKLSSITQYHHHILVQKSEGNRTWQVATNKLICVKLILEESLVMKNEKKTKTKTIIEIGVSVK